MKIAVAPLAVIISTATADDPLDVLIIGGGWSGLGALEALVTSGVTNVQLLEARDSLGGRSYTLQDIFADGLATELGSAWVYEGTKMEELAQQLDLPYGKVPEDYTDDSEWSYLGLYDSNGAISSSQRDVYLNQEWMNNFVPYSQSRATGTAARNTAYQTVVDDYIAQHKLNGTIVPFLNAMIQSQISLEFAAPINEVYAMVGFYANRCIFCGATLFTATQDGGFKRIIDQVASPYQDYIQLQTAVTKIDYTSHDELEEDTSLTVGKSGGGGVDPTNNTSVVRVTYTNGRDDTQHTILAKTVLITVPLGALKANTIDFVPVLPTWKQDAIDTIGFGTLDKCILFWDSPQSWWPDDRLWLTYITSADDDDKDPTHQPGLWTTFSNHRSLGNGGHFVLTAWSSGNAATWAEHYQSEEEIVQQVLARLQQMFQVEIPPPTDQIIKLWGRDPLTYGSYSFGTAGMNNNARDYLSRPVANKLFFAGEATSKLGYGTTFGAYQTGQQAVKTILDTGLLVDQPQVEEDSDSIDDTLSSFAANKSWLVVWIATLAILLSWM